MLSLARTLPILLSGPLLSLAQYTTTISPTNLPDSSQTGQSGYNNCGTSSNQTSGCQNVYLNSVEDFCVWGPPSTTSDEGDGTSKIGNVEQVVVSYCLNDGYGTRLMPGGTVSSAHFVKVETADISYVQVTGTGDFTKIDIPAGDYGGELDPHSWTGLGNPQGGLVFTNAFTGEWEQAHEWTSFISATTYCFRACRDGPNAAQWCQHIYDTLDCSFTIPGSMDNGFDNCAGSPPLSPPGIYHGSTFSQGDAATPPAQSAGATSMCTTVSSVGGSSVNLLAAGATATTTANSSMATSLNSTMTTSTNSTSSMVSSTSMSKSSATVPAAAAVVTAKSSSSSSTASASATASSGAASKLEVSGIAAGLFGALGAMLL